MTRKDYWKVGSKYYVLIDAVKVEVKPNLIAQLEMLRKGVLK
tara:strand:+ start:1004 stop:1129 length:126 start_codon:yes stop_codon:yes gene_type:complete